MTVVDDDGWFVRAPASSANLGAGFDVLGMALDLYADCGLGQAPDDAQQLDAHHPGRIAFEALGGTGPMWMRCNIPMGRGLGFSGAALQIGQALGVGQGSTNPISTTTSNMPGAAGQTPVQGRVHNILLEQVTSFSDVRLDAVGAYHMILTFTITATP